VSSAEGIKFVQGIDWAKDITEVSVQENRTNIANVAPWWFAFLVDFNIPAASHTVQYAFALFEGTMLRLIVMDGKPLIAMYHPELNFMRFKAGCEGSGWDTGTSVVDLTVQLAIITELNYHQNVITLNGKPVSTAYVRPFVYSRNILGVGVGSPDNRPTDAILLSPLDTYFKGKGNAVETGEEVGVTVYFTDVPRRLMKPYLKRAENYGVVADIKREILRNHPDCIEVLFRNQDGYVNEGSAENIAIIKGNKIITPKTDCLPGFTMQILQKIAEANGYEFERRDFGIEELADADAVIMTGNAAGVVLIDKINLAKGLMVGKDELNFGTSKNGVAKTLKREYVKVLNGSKEYGDYFILPAEVLTEQYIRYLIEVSEGWKQMGPDECRKRGIMLASGGLLTYKERNVKAFELDWPHSKDLDKRKRFPRMEDIVLQGAPRMIRERMKTHQKKGFILTKAA
jgi:branched-subunit amino acid aminotransferase/4-amino-4-deoxychorismate lyase